MARDSLSDAGLHFDELNKLRILDPDVSQQTTELKEECRDFVDKIGHFQKVVGGLIELVDELAKETENEKMKCVYFVKGNRCPELVKIYSKAKRSPAAATICLNSREENATRKVPNRIRRSV
uniref:Isoform 2 of Intraflagellar transport protein 20 homolog A n=1 Tax=Xenopus laevis TaxID=8355 RepID=Q90WZ0-2|nr:Ift20 protein [Xenopus laevis]